MSLTIAVIGTGPSGLYLADGILKKCPEAKIDLIDRLPTPYGLVRSGVAPDHQGTKNVVRQYDKLLAQENVRLLGNIEIGKDISADELREIYDILVIATGAQNDRQLGIPGEDLAGVYGSAEFVGWYNGHPDQADHGPIREGAKRAVVIGNGNVSIDISRVLIKEPEEMTESDLVAHARSPIHQASFASVHLVGRRGPVEASFTPPELRELGKLDMAVPVIENASIPEELPEEIDTNTPYGRIKAKNMEILRSFSDLDAKSAEKRVHLVFMASPVEILGDGQVEAVRFEKTKIGEVGRAIGTGEYFDIPADLVVTAIGYYSSPIPGLPFDEKKGIFPNEDGLIETGLYVVGWGKRGPSGTIPTNRPDSFQVANKILEEYGMAGKGKSGPDGLDKLIEERGLNPTGYEDWKKLEAEEESRASGEAPREKITSVDEMLGIIQQA